MGTSRNLYSAAWYAEKTSSEQKYTLMPDGCIVKQKYFTWRGSSLTEKNTEQYQLLSMFELMCYASMACFVLFWLLAMIAMPIVLISFIMGNVLFLLIGLALIPIAMGVGVIGVELDEYIAYVLEEDEEDGSLRS